MPHSSCPDVFLDEGDEFVARMANAYGTVTIKGEAGALYRFYSKDPDQLEALGEAMFAAARDLRCEQAHDVGDELDSFAKGDAA